MLKWNISAKVTSLLLFICFVISATLGWIGYRAGKASLEANTLAHQTSINASKASQLSDHLLTIEHQIRTLSQDKTITEAMLNFGAAFEQLNAGAQQGPADVSAELADFYREDFFMLYRGSASSGGDHLAFLPTSPGGRYLQHHYLAMNPYPIPEHDRLEIAAEDASPYSETHAAYHPSIRNFRNAFGYYDIFLVDVDSEHIVYTVSKETDFGTSLKTGPHRDSNIAEAMRRAKASTDPAAVHFVDFSPYTPSYGNPEAFISTPIVYQGQVIGILIFQISVNKINQIMTGNQGWQEDGLGKTGETYLVGNDLKMRSVSRFLVEDKENYIRALTSLGTPSAVIDQILKHDTTILLQKVETPGSLTVNQGGIDTGIFKDYRGAEVLSSFRPVKFGSLRWAMISEMDTAEAFAPIKTLRRELVLSSFLIGIAVLLLSIRLSRSFTRPIVRLTEAAQRVGMGEKNVQLPVKSNDELGFLTDQFNRMTVNLQEQKETIEYKVEENNRLLLNVLPPPIAERLKSGEARIADAYPAASVLFADIVGFTAMSRGIPPMAVLDLLDDLFGRFDKLALALGVEKIKTIGDAYMAVCGLPTKREAHADPIADLALGMLRTVADFNQERRTNIKVRVGAHSGPVVAGVIGTSKFIYDLWGDAVNIASRMESTGIPNQIQITESFRDTLTEPFDIVTRGEIEVKGAGRLRTYFLTDTSY